MHAHVDGFFAGVVALVSTIISFVFDVPMPTVLAAFIGSCFAVAFSDPVTYKKAAWMILGGTVAAGLLLPLVTHYFNLGEYPQRGLSAVLAFVLIVFRKRLFGVLSARVDRIGDPL
ncbi:hypothetical protein ACW4YW_14975 [Methylobacillus pratensis]